MYSKKLCKYYDILSSVSVDSVTGFPLVIYRCDLLGLDVVDLSGADLGKVLSSASLVIRYDGRSWVGIGTSALWERLFHESSEFYGLYVVYSNALRSNNFSLRDVWLSNWDGRYSYSDIFDISRKYYWDLRHDVMVRCFDIRERFSSELELRRVESGVVRNAFRMVNNMSKYFDDGSWVGYVDGDGKRMHPLEVATTFERVAKGLRHMQKLGDRGGVGVSVVNNNYGDMVSSSGSGINSMSVDSVLESSVSENLGLGYDAQDRILNGMPDTSGVEVVPFDKSKLRDSS